MGRRVAPPIIRRRSTLLVSGLLALVTAGAMLNVTANAAEESADDPQTMACGDGSYNAEVVQDGSTWTAPGYSGDSMPEAIRAGIASLSEGRTSIESVVVRGSGDIGSED